MPTEDEQEKPAQDAPLYRKDLLEMGMCIRRKLLNMVREVEKDFDLPPLRSQE